MGALAPYTFAYNARDELATLSGPGGQTGFTYDAGGRRTQIQNPAGSTRSFTYDPAGRVTSVENRTSAPTSTTSTTVPPTTSTTLPPSTTTTAPATTTTTKGGRLGPEVLSGRITTTSTSSTTTTTLPPTTTTTSTTTTSTTSTTLPPQVVQTFAYTYDAAGNVLSENQQTYGYDALNRLTSWYDPVLLATTSYNYDPSGNLTEVRRNGLLVESYTFDAANQITNPGFAYDENGNLTQNGAYTYLYDQEDRLKEVKQGATSIAQMTYDFLGRRTSLTTGGATTYFHYDGVNVVAETDAAGAVTASYLYDDAGQLVSMTRGGQTYYYQTNAHGDVVALTNAAGTVVNTYSYDPWGEVLSAQEQVVNPYRYAGYRYDSATGLYYLWNRYYSPTLRRFLTVDLAGSEAHSTQGLNGYLYVLNNPLGFVDPSGLRPQPSQFGADLAFALWYGGLAGFGPQPAGGGDWLTNWYNGVVGKVQDAWSTPVFDGPFATDLNITIIPTARGVTLGIIFNRSRDGDVVEWMPYLGGAASLQPGGQIGSISLQSGPGHMVAGGYVEAGLSGGGMGVAAGFKPGHPYYQAGPTLGVPYPAYPSYSVSAYFLLPQPW